MSLMLLLNFGIVLLDFVVKASTTLSLRASLTYHTMSCVWRPFDVEECGTSTTTQKKQDKNNSLKINIREQERAIVLEAYERNVDKGWDAAV